MGSPAAAGCNANSARNCSCGPTSSTSTWWCLEARIAPSTSGLGALSVPIASTAMMVGMGGCGIVIQIGAVAKGLALLLDFYHFAPFVISTFGACAMWHLLLMTIGAL